MASTTQSGNAARRHRILIVEDDPASLEYLRIVLTRAGYETVCADAVAGAQAQALQHGLATFDCVLTDYRMPGLTGLDLLRWLQEKEPVLAAIVVTAEGQKSLIAESFRGGAVDFLEKPVLPAKLLPAVAQAIERTQHQRGLARSESAVRTLGQTQAWMIQACEAGADAERPFKIEVSFHPKLEAGGDFITRLESAEGIHGCLLSDVSGHDLEAAYISAYFQGVFRGMFESAVPPLDIFRSFNRFLVEEWNRSRGGAARATVKTSLAASLVMLDFERGRARVLASGAPAPMLLAADGRIRPLGAGGGMPLGWFADHEVAGAEYPVKAGDMIWLWTDGLEELAMEAGVSPQAMASALHLARERGVKPAELERAQDDILLATIRLWPEVSAGPDHLPLLLAGYRGDQGGEIDDLMAEWAQSLRLVIADLTEADEYDILVATREGVLNAFAHGCQSRADREARLQISYHPKGHSVRVWVEDPGPGHDFDLAAHAEAAAELLLTEHRGLILMTNLAEAVRFERDGATVIMDFTLQTGGNDKHPTNPSKAMHENIF